MAAANFSENKWINQLISIGTSFIVVLFTVWLTTADLDAREIKSEIDKKVDKEDLKLITEPIEKDIEELKKVDEKLEKRDESLRIEFIQELRLLRQSIETKQDKS